MLIIFVGMKKKTPPPADQLLEEILKLHIPKDYVKYFELQEVRNKPDCYELTLHERAEFIPRELDGKEAVLDGFCNPVSILSHSFSLKKIYLIVKRRRWKETCTDKHYSNSYDLYPEGLKATHELVFFFEGLHRGTASES